MNVCTNYLRSADCRQRIHPQPPELPLRRCKACTMPIQFQEKSYKKKKKLYHSWSEMGTWRVFAVVFARVHRFMSFCNTLVCLQNRSTQAKFFESRQIPSGRSHNGPFDYRIFCEFPLGLIYETFFEISSFTLVTLVNNKSCNFKNQMCHLELHIHDFCTACSAWTPCYTNLLQRRTFLCVC